MVCASLILLACTNMFVSAVNIAAKSEAQVAVQTNAQNALRRVMADTREAYGFALPTDATGFTPPESYAASQFEETISGSTVCTGVELTYGSSMPLTVDLSTGSTSSLAVTPYNQNATNNLWIYRADSNGTPDATAGQYLWIYGTEYGQSVNAAVTKIADNSADAIATPTAFEASRPTDSVGTAIPFQVEYQVIASYYGSTTGVQTNTNRSTTLTGECTLLRNHG